MERWVASLRQLVAAKGGLEALEGKERLLIRSGSMCGGWRAVVGSWLGPGSPIQFNPSPSCPPRADRPNPPSSLPSIKPNPGQPQTSQASQPDSLPSATNHPLNSVWETCTPSTSTGTSLSRAGVTPLARPTVVSSSSTVGSSSHHLRPRSPAPRPALTTGMKTEQTRKIKKEELRSLLKSFTRQ